MTVLNSSVVAFLPSYISHMVFEVRRHSLLLQENGSGSSLVKGFPALLWFLNLSARSFFTSISLRSSGVYYTLQVFFKSYARFGFWGVLGSPRNHQHSPETARIEDLERGRTVTVRRTIVP